MITRPSTSVSIPNLPSTALNSCPCDSISNFATLSKSAFCKVFSLMIGMEIKHFTISFGSRNPRILLHNSSNSFVVMSLTESSAFCRIVPMWSAMGERNLERLRPGAGAYETIVFHLREKFVHKCDACSTQFAYSLLSKTPPSYSAPRLQECIVDGEWVDGGSVYCRQCSEVRRKRQESLVPK